jgi:hypothetical protein
MKGAPATDRHLVLLIAIVVVGGTIATWRQEQTTERSNKAISQPLAPQATPTSIPTPGRARSWKEYFANTPPTPLKKAANVLPDLAR